MSVSTQCMHHILVRNIFFPYTKMHDYQRWAFPQTAIKCFKLFTGSTQFVLMPSNIQRDSTGVSYAITTRSLQKRGGKNNPLTCKHTCDPPWRSPYAPANNHIHVEILETLCDTAVQTRSVLESLVAALTLTWARSSSRQIAFHRQERVLHDRRHESKVSNESALAFFRRQIGSPYHPSPKLRGQHGGVLPGQYAEREKAVIAATGSRSSGFKLKMLSLLWLVGTKRRCVRVFPVNAPFPSCNV